MKVRKAIKRIAALGVGATMIGATMMGALAADLNQYPGMFIKDGQFQGILVIGKEAQATDTIGMTNVALGLQAAAKTCTQVCSSGGSGAVTVDKGVELGDDNIFFGQNINVATTSVDGGDLDFLKDGTFDDNEDAGGDGYENEVDYEQEITIGANVFNFFQDDDDFPKAGPAVLLDTSTTMYTYTLTFDSPVEYTDKNADLQGVNIDIQGRTYTITKARFSSKKLDELTLQSGETSIWLTKGDEPLEKNIGGVEHTIEVVGVNQAEDKCLLKVDGISTTINKGSTRNVGGVDIGVIDVVAVNTAGGQTMSPDMCKLTLGSDEIVLKHNNKVKINGDDVDDSKIVFNGLVAAGSGTPGKVSGMTITFEPDEDVYLGVGDGFIDPVFQNFKIYFANLKTSRESDVQFTASGRNGKITLVNSDNQDLELKLRQNTATSVVLGDGDNLKNRIYIEGQTCAGNIDTCEGASFLFTKDDKLARVIKITEFDEDNNQTSFRDLTAGRDITDKSVTFDGARNATINLGSGYGSIRLVLTGGVDFSTATAITFADVTPGGSGATFKDKDDNEYTITMAANGVQVRIVEYEDSKTLTDPSTFYVNASKDSVDNEVQFRTSFDANTVAEVNADDGDSADTITVTEKGSWVRYNTDDDKDDKVTVKLYRDSVYAQVFLAPTGASSTGGTTKAGCTESCTINPIPSTANKFDTEVSNARAQNVIAIGGPCANSVTAALMNNPEVCYEGFEAGKALIKLVETGDKVALIVAGGTGMDTQLASRILQNYGQYKLEGKEMVATTVSESSLKVNKVQ